jgi:hypothetical protein
MSDWNDHPDFVAMKARHRTEIDELTQAFGKRHAELHNLQPGLRDPKMIIALRTKHRTDIKEAVARHVKAENEWRPPAPKAEAVEPAAHD